MNIYTIYQEGSSASHWISQYLKGIKDESKRKGNEVKLIEYGADASVFPDELTIAGSAIVIVGTSSWTKGVCSYLSERCVKPILIGCDSNEAYSAKAHVLMDYNKAIVDLLDYFAACHKKRVALFAVNLQSPTDRMKMKSFLDYRGKNGEKFDQQDIFYFRGMTKNTCDSFISVCSSYDAVIGTNDVSTVIMLQMLGAAGIKVPDDIFVASFGDVSLSKSTTSGLTLALLDCYSVGVHAVKMYSMLSGSKRLSGAVMRLECTIDVRNSTANIPISNTRTKTDDTQDMTHISFFDDPHISEIVLAEHVLDKCDRLDLEIMKSLINKEKYIDIADKLHISENTVKYRIKRLLNFAKLNSRSELTELMKSYLV